MPKTRTGSSMSTRQMAYAATAGRKVTFWFLASDIHLEGYLVGMDDYHWLIAASKGDDVETTLVHKSSADLVTISKESSLDSEPDTVKVAVEEIGRGFFAFCDRTYFGKTIVPPANDQN